ncbi:uncharacterized protein [Asterias amurensis]|uniref:uncharacterized protein isoform X2 n=1 Tax=Asterias amurensis TaxID=7602 RepID=UPI003AB2EFB2
MKLERMCGEEEVSSGLTVSSTTRSDRVEIPKNVPAEITGCGRTKGASPVYLVLNSAKNKRCHAEKRKPKRFAWLGRMFSCRQIDPLTSKDDDIQLEPDSSRKSAFPCGGISQSNGRLTGLAPVRGQLVISSTSPPSDQNKLSKNVASTRSRSKRKHRLFRSNKIGILNEFGIRTELHRAQTHTDISVFNTSNSRREITSSKTNSPRPVLATLWGIFTGCFRRKEGRNKGEPYSYNTSASSNINDDDRAVSSNCTLALPQYPGGEIAECYTVDSEKTSSGSQMFGFGSGGESICTERRTIMGQVISGPKEETHHSCKRRKTVANKQTSVDAADLQRTAVELQLGHIIKPNVIKLPAITKLPTITSSDTVQDHALPYPTINEKDLRRANKEGRPLVLGRGQSGVVRLMRYHQSDGSSSLVAVKRLISGTSSGTQVALMREIRAMLDVEQCPIFPRVVGVINKQSFAQEYIGNPKSLASLSITKALRGRPQISLLNWILIITDVVEGLSALHQSGWAHCDIQTNNVLLWKNWGRKEAITRWEARIIDLGNAKWLESSRCLSLSSTEKETYYRNCRHIPAEVVEGQAPYSIASDIHSLGVLITDIASKITSLTAILPLADSCTTLDYKLRPSTQLFMKDLDTWCYDQTGCNISQLKSQIITYV